MKKIFICIPLCMNIIMMLIIVVYIFAVIGVEIFNPAPLYNKFSKVECTIEDMKNFGFYDWGSNLFLYNMSI